MTEERITKSILNWLQTNGWIIECFDFPQSGTGRVLHPETINSSKNMAAVIPDIVAHKNQVVVFFENKTSFSSGDIEKLVVLKATDLYRNSINQMLALVSYSRIFYGIGLAETASNFSKIQKDQEAIDFYISVNDSRDIIIKYDPYNIFI